MALDPCCDVIIGGEIYITAVFNGPGASGGQGQGGGAGRYEAMGEVRIQPSALERTAGASSAGAVWVTEVSRPVRAILTFANRCSNNPMRMYCERCKIHVDIVEKSRGVTHSMTDCVTVGLPEVNLNTGEISGIEIVCAGTYTVEEAGNIEKQQCYKSYYNPMMGTFDQGSATGTNV